MTRTILIVVLAIFAAPLLAQEAAAATTFFIERIEVRNAKRVSPDVIIAESRLREGREYSEEELRDASTRLSRLPFLLSADFSLEKGAERGRHVLVISIVETRPFFYAFDIRPIFRNDDYLPVDYSDRIGTSDTDGALGMRFFIGRRGAVHFGIFGENFQHDFADDYTAFAVGYTQYDLFGTRAFATLNLKRVIGGYDGASISPQVVVGVPLSPNQTLTLAVDQTHFGVRDFQLPDQTIEGSRRFQRLITASWTYNTTNHPFLPTRGMLLQAKPILSWNEGVSFSGIIRPDGYEVTAHKTDTRALAMELAAARYWEISDRDSVSGGIEGSFGRAKYRRDNVETATDNGQLLVLRGGFSHSLWDRNRMKDGDSRLELNIRLARRFGNRFDYRYLAQTEQVSFSWVRRSSWGTLRLGAGYAW